MINKIGKTYERPWGSYQTLTLENKYQVKLICVKSQEALSLQKHQQRSEHWIVVEGFPTITIDDVIKTYKANDHVFIPINSVHRIANHENEVAKIIEIQLGDYLGEDDIIRIEDIYGRG